MPVVFDEVEGTVADGPEQRPEQHQAEAPAEAMTPPRFSDEFRKLEQREARLRAD